MEKIICEVGRRYGHLLVLGEFKNDGSKTRPKWVVQCDCGKILPVDKYLIAHSVQTCCGCYSKMNRINACTTQYGMSRSKIYKRYRSMKDRCYRESEKGYKHYGGRGITVCESWRNSFKTFLKDMGEPPLGYSLDRIDNNGNYCKENCRWATWSDQASNKRTIKKYNYQGGQYTVKALCIMLGLRYNTILHRLSVMHLPIEVAIKDEIPTEYLHRKKRRTANVMSFDIDGKECNAYDGAISAAQSVNRTAPAIRTAIKNKTFYKGFYWKYV